MDLITGVALILSLIILLLALLPRESKPKNDQPFPEWTDTGKWGSNGFVPKGRNKRKTRHMRGDK